MDPDEGIIHGNAARSPRPAPLPYNAAPAMTLNPYENPSYIGFMSSAPQPDEPMSDPPTAFKRLIVQIGCQHPPLVEKNHDSNVVEQKRVPKILKAINDPKMTVEDWLYDLLNSGDIPNEELVNLFQHQNRIITVNYGTTSLMLSLGPNRSIPINAIKSKKGLKCTKSPSKEDANGKKRNRKNSPKSLRIELVMSRSNVLLCPRDPIFQLIDSNEEYVLRSAGEGSWDGREIAGTTAGGSDGDSIDAPEPVETETPRLESPPAKRQKLRKEPRTPQQQQQPVASAKKREKIKKQGEEISYSKANGDRETEAKVDGASKIDHHSESSGQKSKKGVPQKSKASITTQEKTPKRKKTTVAASAKKREKTKKQRQEGIDSKANGDREAEAKVDGASKIDRQSESSNKEGQKSKKSVPQKSKASIPTPEKTSKQKTDVDTKKKKKTSFSERDVLLGNGNEQRQNKGNTNYNEYIDSESLEYDDYRNRSKIVDGVRSEFKFYKKEKGSDSWDLLQRNSGYVANKIRRDLQNHFNRHQKNKNGNVTKDKEKPKVLKTKSIETVGTKDETARHDNQKSNYDSSSHDSDKDGLNESIIDGSSEHDSDEDENLSKNPEGGSVADETDQVVQKEEEDIGEKQTNEKDDEKQISATTSKGKDPGTDQSDSDDESSSSSSSTNSGSEMENVDESESENEIERKNNSYKSRISEKNSTTQLKKGNNDSPTRIVTENENRINDTDAFPNQEDTKNDGELKSTGRGDERHSSSTNPEEGSDSDSDSDDDSTTSSSVSSSDSSSTDSSSVSTSDEDSSSSSSTGDDSSASEKKKKPEASRAKQIKQPKSGRKPLLDPKKPFIFPDTNRRLSYADV